MRRIDLAVILAVSLILAPLATEAYQAGTLYRIGLLGMASGPVVPRTRPGVD
jgi:hypothetical protein